MRTTVAASVVRSVGLVGVAAALLLMTACKSPVVGTRTGPRTAPTGAPVSGQPTPGNTASASNPGNAGKGTGGPGTVTVSISEPVSMSGHAGTEVSCTSGRVYTATAQSATIEGYQVFFTVRVTPYRGPGTYPALVTVRLNSANGAVTTVSGVPNINADISNSGGSFTVNATGDNGRTLNASLQWTCS